MLDEDIRASVKELSPATNSAISSRHTSTRSLNIDTTSPNSSFRSFMNRLSPSKKKTSHLGLEAGMSPMAAAAPIATSHVSLETVMSPMATTAPAAAAAVADNSNKSSYYAYVRTKHRRATSIMDLSSRTLHLDSYNNDDMGYSGERDMEMGMMVVMEDSIDDDDDDDDDGGGPMTPPRPPPFVVRS